jgi:hypothetical protein
MELLKEPSRVLMMEYTKGMMMGWTMVARTDFL